ncbi:MAG: hypothetical protein KGH86_07720 [Thaumarchaeota archaeon]|nr:hypothetical protein [Nitrososphaerota archaeon]
MNNLKLLGFIAIVFLVGSVFASQASAQYQSQSGAPRSFQGQRTPVNGTYVNPNYGFQITLPDGWSGFEMKRTSGATSVIAAPGGFTMQPGGPRPAASMMINIESKSTNPTPMLMSQRMSQNMTCNNDSNLVKTINGLSITEVVMDCSGATNTLKAKYDIAQTNSSYIVIGYRSTAANYDSQVAAFDTAVNTLQVSNALGAPAIPEFPVSLVAVITAVMVGTVVIFGRLKLIPGSI